MLNLSFSARGGISRAMYWMNRVWSWESRITLVIFPRVENSLGHAMGRHRTSGPYKEGNLFLIKGEVNPSELRISYWQEIITLLHLLHYYPRSLGDWAV